MVTIALFVKSAILLYSILMKKFLQNLKSREATSVYYVGSFLDTFSVALTFSIYVIFLLQNHLTLFQASLINAVYMTSCVFLEVPTGAFADAIGRKKSVLISTIFSAAGLFLYPMFHTIVSFIIAEFFWAVGTCFASGAFDAWVVDTSKKQGFIGKVDFIFANATIFSRAALILAGLSGAYLATINIALPFYLGGVVSIICFFFFLFNMDENREIKKSSMREHARNIRAVAVDSIKYAWAHNVIFWLILAGAVVSFVVQPLNMFWAPRFNAMVGNHIWITGWIWAIITLAMLAGSYLVAILLKKGKSYTFIMVIAYLTIGIFVGLSAATKLFAIALPAYLVYEMAQGMTNPVYTAYINKYATEDKRATIFSFESMTGSLAAALGLAFFGWIATRTSIEVSWTISAILVLSLIPIYLIAHKKSAVISAEPNVANPNL